MGLALSRVPGESITIIDGRTGERLCDIKLDKIHGDFENMKSNQNATARLWVTAPNYIRVARTEIAFDMMDDIERKLRTKCP